eukprot:TRINITY_DN26601_c0_g1_i1.p1 TRINITY_DN26601_c0_g1~~TRINITY_DN26601_c0_g1_i1.p1  ORF type:complete len:313 (+),score=84.85 TRINITY_DN26601_c0_g1_i1:187-1125(+)
MIPGRQLVLFLVAAIAALPLAAKLLRIASVLWLASRGVGDLIPPGEFVPDYSPSGEFPIPPLVHHIWKTTNLSTYPMEPFKGMVNSLEAWRRRYPDYSFKLWTDQDIDQLVRTEYAWLYPTFRAYPYNIQRADAARLAVLHREGGIYADLDLFPSRQDIIAFRRKHLVLLTDSNRRACTNFFIMAEPRSAFLEYALRSLRTHSEWLVVPYLSVFASTGPLFITDVFRRWIRQHQEFDYALFDQVQARPWVYHFAGRSWLAWDGQLFYWLHDHPVLVAVPVSVMVAVVSAVVCWRRRWLHNCRTGSRVKKSDV